MFACIIGTDGTCGVSAMWADTSRITEDGHRMLPRNVGGGAVWVNVIIEINSNEMSKLPNNNNNKTIHHN